MAINRPDFNLTSDFWQPGHTPAANAPDVLAVPVQFYWYARPSQDVNSFGPEGQLYDPSIYLRAAHNTYSVLGALTTSIWSINDGLGNVWYYRVVWWEYAHLGFSNQYLMMRVVPTDNAGVFHLHP